MRMFDKFGEFDSAEEINETAAGLLEEGDLEGLREMAKENGFDEDDVQDYIDGIYPELANTYTAAWNKLEVEMKELKVCEIMEDWVEYIRIKMEEEEEMQRAIRKKGKSLQGCIAALLKWSWEHQNPVNKEVLKEAGVKDPRVTLGIPGMGTAKKVITKYYLGR
jgi:hypothetical protein